MRRLITVLSCLILLALATTSLAQVRRDAHLLSANYSYGLAKSARTGDDLNGNGFVIGYEKVARSREWTIGGGFGMTKSSERYAPADTSLGVPEIQADYTSWMLSVYGRIYPAPDNKLSPYLGFGLGVNFMGASLNTETDDVDTSSNGMAISVPIGLQWFLFKNWFLNGNYTFNYLANNDIIDGNIKHVFNLGIGVQLGP